MGTANVSTGSLAAGAYSGGILADLTITGDSVHGLLLDLSGYSYYQSAGTAGGHTAALIYDATAAVYVGGSQYPPTAIGTSNGDLHCRAYVAPFSGSKTFRYHIFNGNPAATTFINQAGATFPTIMTATWIAP